MSDVNLHSTILVMIKSNNYVVHISEWEIKTSVLKHIMHPNHISQGFEIYWS